MRKFLVIAFAIVVLAGAYVAWPFYGLYRLAEAARTRDVAALGERVDLVAIRQSIIFQVLSEVAADDDRMNRYGAFGRDLAVNLATQAIDARLAEVVTVDAIAHLLTDGELPPELARHASAVPGNAAAGTPSLTSFREAPLDLLRRWGFKAYDKFSVSLGDASETAEWTTLTLKLRGTTWQLWAVDLPASLVVRLKPAIKARMDELG